MLILEDVKCYYCGRILVLKLHLPLLTQHLPLRCPKCHKTFDIHVVSEDQRLIYSYVNLN